jgi:NADH dehydrogenase
MIGTERVNAANVIWAAGVQASPLGASLGAPLDRAGRVKVGMDLSIGGHPEVLVIGDMACVVDPRTGRQVPGICPAAIQAGKYAARIIRQEAVALERGRPTAPRRPFHYLDKGTLATIGRNKAVAVIRALRFSGVIAWLLWALVHIFFLIGFRNRLLVMLEWAYVYFFFDRGARLITGEVKLPGRDACEVGGALRGGDSGGTVAPDRVRAGAVSGPRAETR